MEKTPRVTGGLSRLAVLLLAAALLSGRFLADDATSALAAAIAEGDANYEQRAEQANGAAADPARIDAALAAYRRALAVEPDDLEAAWKLLRALFFRASFCAGADAERKPFVDEGRTLGQQAVDRVERQARAQPARARIPSLAGGPQAAPLYCWTAVNWGQWALLHGKLAAARSGAAGRIRDLAQAVLELDPALEQGGADRLLGRLHHQAPKIPFLTGWVSRTKAVAHL